MLLEEISKTILRTLLTASRKITNFLVIIDQLFKFVKTILKDSYISSFYTGLFFLNREQIQNLFEFHFIKADTM